MIAIHCSIYQSHAYLWVEQGLQRSVDDKGKEHVLQRHAMAPPRRVLAEVIERVSPAMEVSRGSTARLQAWLPARRGIPLASSALLGEHPSAGTRATLAPVAVHALRLSIDEYIDFVTFATQESTRSPGILPGTSLLWSARLLRLALTLVAEGNMLPALQREGDGWHARWLPMPARSGQEERASLVEQLPASLRCLTASDEEAPRYAPADIVDDMLAQLVDALARDPLEMHDAPPDEGAPPKRKGRRKLRRVGDVWLDALVSKDGLVAWPDTAELEEFAARLSQWRRPVELTSAAPWILAFRLHEPEAPDTLPEDAVFVADERNGWRLEFLVRPRGDASLHLPLKKVWKPKSRAARALHTEDGRLTEFLYGALSQAATMFPPIARGMTGARPAETALSADEALDLLRLQGIELQAAGFELLFPSWWKAGDRSTRPSLHAGVRTGSSNGVAQLSLDAVLDFDIEAMLGGQKVSIDELSALVKLKAPLVRLRGKWTQVDPVEMASILRMLTKGESGRITARDALALAFGAERHVGGLRLSGATLQGWIADLAEMLQGTRQPEILEQPVAFHGTLRPYQQRGYSWLAFLRKWRLGSCLADDMGLGKTVQALAMIQHDRAQGERRPVLLICPTSVVNNWKREAERFTPDLPVLIHHGSDRVREDAFRSEAGRTALVVSTYGLLHRDGKLFNDIDWAGVLLDEAQNIKNPDTKQARSARELPAGYRIALTGTPVENAVTDLWSIMEFLNPGLLGSRNSFTENFQKPIQRRGDEAAMARLRSLTAPFILRRMKTDRSIIADLPDKIEQKQYCSLTPEQASLYAAVLADVHEGLADSEGMKRRSMMLTTLLRLKQVCNHPAHFLADGSSLQRRSGKLHRLLDILDEIRLAGERVLVFTQFTEMASLLRRAVEEHLTEEALFLHGGVSRKKRDEMITRFQSDPDAPTVFILSLKAGGTGLNLTRANHVIHYDRWWNPAVENQATDRAFRIGQKKNVQVHAFISAGTLEERIDALMERKRDIAERVVGAGEQWITEMSNDDFLELIQLGADAVEEAA
jgi:superfamily II DNA or RNA helicase